MKQRQILKQTYEVSNSFDTPQMITAIKAQVENQIFTELIRKENHSLTLEFKIFVNEEEEQDYEDKQKLESLKINKKLLDFLASDEFKEMTDKSLPLLSLYMDLGKIDFTQLNKFEKQKQS